MDNPDRLLPLVRVLYNVVSRRNAAQVSILIVKAQKARAMASRCLDFDDGRGHAVDHFVPVHVDNYKGTALPHASLKRSPASNIPLRGKESNISNFDGQIAQCPQRRQP